MTVQEEVRICIALDVMLARLRKKIESGKATYADTAAYSIRAGKLLGQIFSRRLPEIPPEEREPLCVELLHDQYIDINAAVDAAQRYLDERLGIQLAPQHAPFDAERGHQIGSSLRDPSKPVETLQRRAKAATETTVKSMHDDRMKTEAKFRSRAGLKCFITRKAVSGCCAWCTAMAGRFEYGEEPDDIYRRHDNCDCTVTFENGRKRQDVWSKREWETPEPGAGAGDPVVLTKEQAEELQKKHGLTKLEDRSIINYARAIDSMFYADDYEHETYTKEEIIENLKTSAVGLEAIQYLEDNPQVKVKLSEDREASERGSHYKNLLTINLNRCPNVRVAAQTVVHEVTHHRFDIGGSQQAETICYAFEKMHKEKRKYLTQEEWDALVRLAENQYWDLPAVGGVENVERFDFIVKKG